MKGKKMILVGIMMLKLVPIECEHFVTFSIMEKVNSLLMMLHSLENRVLVPESSEDVLIFIHEIGTGW